MNKRFDTIPTRFTVGGQEMLVEYGNKEVLGSNLGMCSLSHGKIHIDNDQTWSSKKNTFVHELIHTCLDTIGRADLSEDESFVCSLTAILMEAMGTMEFDETKVNKSPEIRDPQLGCSPEGEPQLIDGLGEPINIDINPIPAARIKKTDKPIKSDIVVDDSGYNYDVVMDDNGHSYIKSSTIQSGLLTNTFDPYIFDVKYNGEE